MATNTLKHAEIEFTILEKYAPKDMRLAFRYELLALAQRFGLSGESGSSAPIIATMLGQAVANICLQQPLSPVTGDAMEWVDVSTDGQEPGFLYQNKRCYNLFKHGLDDDCKGFFLDAIVFCERGTDYQYTGSAFYGKNEQVITSRQRVKSYPFTPRTFYIDVHDLGNEWVVTDETDLKQVFEYYDLR